MTLDSKLALPATLLSVLVASCTPQEPADVVPPEESATVAGVETIDTPIGELELELGVPTESSVEKLFDAMDFQRACQENDDE